MPDGNRQPPRDYGIIYNWDGAPLHYSEFPQSQEQFLEKVYAPIADTQVGAHFWSVGGHETEWPTESLEYTGDSVGRVYDSVLAVRHDEGVRAMFERGENPYQAMVERGHELGVDVYCSVRMNDNHFYGILPRDMAKTVRHGLTQIRKDHPEWCLQPEDVPEQRGIGSWNMAFPEVREHRLQYVTEACRQADWDGVEIDWQRHPFHLPEHDGYRLRYTLTDLQRAIREMTDRIADERGKPFYLAVRVAATMESCRRIGYDLETWARDGLCDIVIAAGGSGTDPDTEVEAFRDLLDGTGIKLYAGYDTDGRQDAKRLVPYRTWQHAWLWATAAGHWDRGVDGVYAFNWHADSQTRRDLLTTIGSRETLNGKDKIYAAIHRGPPAGGDAAAGSGLNDRIYGETAVVLYRTLTGDGPLFHVSVHDDVVSESSAGRLVGTELHVEIEHFAPGDRVAVTLDGNELGGPAICNVAAEAPNVPEDVAENSWLVWSLSPEQAARGRHEVKVLLLERDARIRSELVVAHVEIHVRYKGTE